MTDHLSNYHLSIFSPLENNPNERLWNIKFRLSSLEECNQKSDIIKINLERAKICEDAINSLRNFVTKELELNQGNMILNTASFVIFEKQIHELVKNAYDENANILSFSLYANLDSLSNVMIRAENNGDLFLDADKKVVEDASYDRIKKNVTSPKLKDHAYKFGGKNCGLKNTFAALKNFSGSLIVNCPFVPPEFHQGCTIDLVSPYDPAITALDVKRFLREQLSQLTTKEGVLSFHKETFFKENSSTQITIDLATLKNAHEARLLRNHERIKTSI